MSTIQVLIISGILSAVAYIIGSWRGFRAGFHIGIGVGMTARIERHKKNHPVEIVE